MEELKNHIYDETNGLWYERKGDYYIPMICLPEEDRPIGKQGRIYREYLKLTNTALLNDLILSGKLWTYLVYLNEQAQNRLDCIIAQMKEAEGITEELKTQDQMSWVRAMNSIHSRAEEIILRELIYEEDAV